MKRFLMLVGVAAVAGAMYVAAAPGSRQASPPTARQFATLKRQVAAIQKKLKAVKTEADGEAAVLLHCMLHQIIGVNRAGDPAGTFGYSFTPQGGAAGFTTGLDLAPSTTGATYLIAAFNSDPACQPFIGVASSQSQVAFAQKP
jgi:hypothetical protein